MTDVVRAPGRRLREFHGLLTVAPVMDSLFVTVRRAARSGFTVVVTGESGTGKELVARALHAESARANGPFLAVNCAAFTPALLESELFGHTRGAFTGAIRDRPGLFALADGGTLFLDEVTDIPLDMQGKLLRVLQEKVFVPVGGGQPMSVDVRLVSATNRPLLDEVSAGRLRADLAYRLRVISISLPPLRARPGDIAALFWHFVGVVNALGLRRIDGITRRALDALQAHHWPGNVREMRSVVEAAAVMGEGPIVDVGDLPPELRAMSSVPIVRRRSRLHDEERNRIIAALRNHAGRKGEAAAALGVSRQTLWRKLYAYRID